MFTVIQNSLATNAGPQRAELHDPRGSWNPPRRIFPSTIAKSILETSTLLNHKPGMERGGLVYAGAYGFTYATKAKDAIGCRRKNDFENIMEAK